MVNFTNIQGNILKGFNKPYNLFIFFRFKKENNIRSWLKIIGKQLCSTNQIINASIDFKEKRKVNQFYNPNETWLHLSFSANGIKKLRKKLPCSITNLDTFAKESNSYPFDDPFEYGMKTRASLLGDHGESSPEKWIEPFKSIGIDAMIIVASDTLKDAEIAVDNLRKNAQELGLSIVGLEIGQIIKNAQGKNIEHFGFADGISQPLIKGIDESTNPNEDIFNPEHFILTNQIDSWMNEGSFLVFRRLRQKVEDFWNFVDRRSQELGLSSNELAAKFVGRWKSGAPLAKYPEKDPETKIASDENDFVYMKDDPDGYKTPRFAHIRKVYPRDDGNKIVKGTKNVNTEGNEEENDNHRILRRGIPFTKKIGVKSFEKGLLFVSYQRNLREQFEHLQISFSNSKAFPEAQSKMYHGHDPIIGRPKEGEKAFINLNLNGNMKKIEGLQQWVVTTGGEYFFSPSLSAVKYL